MSQYNDRALCQFLPVSEGKISTINFVYEPFPYDCVDFESKDFYCMYLITEGEVVFSTKFKDYKLKCGDIFFSFPKYLYKYVQIKKLEMIYITFEGSYISTLFEKLNINYLNSARYGLSSLISRWNDDFKRVYTSNFPELITESLILYTLSFFSVKSSNCEKNKKNVLLGEIILSYVDKNYFDSELSLIKLSKIFHYHYNYISQIFRNYQGINFSKYLVKLRLQHAIELLKNSEKSIKEIAISVGLNDQLYFNRLFNKYYCQSPSKYRSEYKKLSVNTIKDLLYYKFYVD